MSTRPGPGTTCSWLLLIGANILWVGSYVASSGVLRELSVMMMLSLRVWAGRASGIAVARVARDLSCV
jgi:hypothetical protein